MVSVLRSIFGIVLSIITKCLLMARFSGQCSSRICLSTWFICVPANIYKLCFHFHSFLAQPLPVPKGPSSVFRGWARPCEERSLRLEQHGKWHSRRFLSSGSWWPPNRVHVLPPGQGHPNPDHTPTQTAHQPCRGLRDCPRVPST